MVMDCAVQGKYSRAHGLTLVELMVTLAVLAFLLLLGLPMGSDWINSARTQQARSDIEQGWGMSKALALRNPCQTLSEDAAAYLALQHDAAGGYTAAVHAWGTADNCAYVANRPEPVWTGQLPKGIEIHINGAVLAAGAQQRWLINSRGLLASGGADTPTVVVRRGGTQNDETIQWR
ncbi:MAG: prepilin-type N-terminal cleavage/methylation domain-containing protein [Comamonas sp.]|nr:prepilin-type N-terminal cleavage/methylation domain-containing protein [Comamonas sp.]